jgi:hypothetical protein
MSRQPGVEVKLLLIGGLIGLVIGVTITVCYYSLTTFLAVSAKTLKTTQNIAEIANETAEDEKRTGRVGRGDRGLGREVPPSAKDKSSKSKRSTQMRIRQTFAVIDPLNTHPLHRRLRRRIRAWPT